MMQQRIFLSLLTSTSVIIAEYVIPIAYGAMISTGVNSAAKSPARSKPQIKIKEARQQFKDQINGPLPSKVRDY